MISKTKSSKTKFSKTNVIIKVNGKDVALCIGYWVVDDCDYYEYNGYNGCGDDCFYIIETVNGLPGTLFSESTIDKIIDLIFNRD